MLILLIKLYHSLDNVNEISTKNYKKYIINWKRLLFIFKSRTNTSFLIIQQLVLQAGFKSLFQSIKLSDFFTKNA